MGLSMPQARIAFPIAKTLKDVTFLVLSVDVTTRYGDHPRDVCLGRSQMLTLSSFIRFLLPRSGFAPAPPDRDLLGSGVRVFFFRNIHVRLVNLRSSPGLPTLRGVQQGDTLLGIP